MPVDRFRALADRTDALLVARLGDPAILADGRTVYGDFVSPFVGAEIGGKNGAMKLGTAINADAVLEPGLTVRTVDVPDVKKGDFLTIDLPKNLGGGRYKVVRPEPDGTGMVKLVLGVSSERTDDIT